VDSTPTLFLVEQSVSVVSRIMALLHAVAKHQPGGGTTAAIARDARLARPTAHRLLSAMIDEGLTDRGRDGRWVLGPEIYILASTAASRYDVSAAAQPVVRHLSTVTEESAFYSIRRGYETVCLLQQEGSFPLRSHVLYEGIRFPLGVASAGLAILAFLPDAQVDAYLDGSDLTSEYGQPHSPAAIRERVAEARERGFAVNPGLIVEGSWGMAAPVLDRMGSPVGALTITGVERRFAPDRQPELGKLLRRAAHQLSTALEKGGR